MRKRSPRTPGGLFYLKNQFFPTNSDCKVFNLAEVHCAFCDNLIRCQFRFQSDSGSWQAADMAIESSKNPAAVALGRLGGLKGGPALAAKMTPAQRKASARRAALARWSKKSKKP